MNPERWHRIEVLYHAALEHEPAERAVFLADACKHDSELRKEVESLLNDGSSPLDVSLREVADDLLGAETELLLGSGTRLGAYEILGLLGQGGMGTVYRARDTRLDRDVAIKITANGFDERFQREVRAIAALNHPNICTLFDVGPDYLVMELVEGPTLEDLIGKGAIQFKAALSIAKQIADALQAAHDKGIIHRDLKPANVKLTADGNVKVLDFGLAKVDHENLLAPGETATHVTAGTMPGVVMGTAAYMAPEQARGEPIDKRADIWAFGVLVYEMMTRKRPFSGNTTTDVVAAVLMSEPAWDEVPAQVRRLLQRCLDKDPKLRIRDIGDVWLALDEPSATTRAPWRLSSRTLILAACGVVAVGSTIWYAASKHVNGHPAISLSMNQLTTQAGKEVYPSLSLDGKSVVYASDASGNWDIYLQRVDGGRAINLTRDSVADDRHPAFSPDGGRIAFRSERDSGGIFVMGATGESVRRITDFGYQPSWSPEGREICVATEDAMRTTSRPNVSALWIVPVDPGQKHLLATAGDAVKPSWSPHGYRVAFWGAPYGHPNIYTVSATGHEKPISVTNDVYNDWQPAWSPDGDYLYFLSDRSGIMNIWRVRIDERSGEILRPPEAVTTSASPISHLSVGGGGRLAYAQTSVRANIQRVTLDPVTERVAGGPEWMTAGSNAFTSLDVSPDGKWIAFLSRAGQTDIMIMHTDGTGLRHLTDDLHEDTQPRWHPDGRRIAFASRRSGNMEIWIINSDGSGLEQITRTPGPNRSVMYPQWSTDGAWLSYYLVDDGTYILDASRPWAGQTPRPLLRPDEGVKGFAARAWSPDGQKIAGMLTPRTPGSSGIALYHVGSARFEKITESGIDPVWLNDNRRLLILENMNTVSIIDTTTRKKRPLYSVAPAGIQGKFAVSKDNRTIYVSVLMAEADLWLARLQ